MLPLRSLTLLAISSLAVSAASVLRSRQSDITGACTCDVTKCEHTDNVQGCDSPITFGDTNANFCLMNGGQQWLYQSYNDYVHEGTPTIVCGSDTGSVSTSCTCSAYTGNNLGDLSIKTYPKNSAGFVTDPTYYGGTIPKGACYCDIYSTTGGGQTLANANEATLPPLGYYSLGTATEPVWCDGGDGVQDQEGGNFLATCGYADNGDGLVTPQNFCQCVATTGGASGSVVNGTQSVVDSGVHQDLVAAVQSSHNSNNNGNNGVVGPPNTAVHNGFAPWLMGLALGMTAFLLL